MDTVYGVFSIKENRGFADGDKKSERKMEMNKGKKAKKWLAVVLSVALLLCGIFQVDGITKAEEQSGVTYDAVKEFSTSGNPDGVWGYESRIFANGEYVYTPMSLDATGNYWTCPATGYDYCSIGVDNGGDKVTTVTDPVLCFKYNDEIHESVLTFKAPQTGTISISMGFGGIYAPFNSTDAARFSILHNEETLFTKNDLDNAYGAFWFRDTVGTITVSVNKGDLIRFIGGRNVGADGTTYFNPCVTYREVAEEKQLVFNAYEDYSAEKNPNGAWSFSYLQNGAYTDLTYDASAEQWGTAVPGYVRKTTEHPHDYVTGQPALEIRPESLGVAVVVRFTAPYSGKVNVSMANWSVFSPHQSQDEVSFTFKHEDTVIKSVTDLDSAYNQDYFFKAPVELTINKGDVLQFQVQRNQQSADPRTYFNPLIEYTEVTEEQKLKFNAYEDYSTEKNPNGAWAFSYLQNGAYTDLTYNATAGQWGTAVPGYLTKTTVHPHDYVTGQPALEIRPESLGVAVVVSFTAPYTGKVNVSMANGSVFAPHQSMDEVTFTFKHNNTVVKSVVDLDNSYNTNYCFGDTVTLTVNKGDVLRFLVQRNQQSADPRTYFNPLIEYTEVETTPAGMTYYISVSGNDSYSGTVPTSPWKSLSKLSNLPLNENDRILLKRGDTFTEQLVLNNVHGTEKNPVVIGSYGEGAAPVINAGITDDSTTSFIELATPVVKLVDAEGIEIDGLTITGSGVGIHLAYNNTFNNEYVKIKNCTFKDLTGFTIRDYRGENNHGENTTGVYSMATAVCTSVNNYNIGVNDPALIGLYIENCDTVNCGTLYASAGSINGTNEGGSVAVSGLYIRECTMTRNDYYGAYIADVQGGYMTDCVVDTCGDAEYFSPGTAGVLVSAKDYAIINTEIRNQQRGGCAYDGVGIDLEHLCENVTIRNCWFHDNTGAGVFLYDSGAGSSNANIDCNVVNNLFENNAGSANGSEAHDDPVADIRITSSTGYAMKGGKIAGNQYYNARSDYQFINRAEREPSDTVEIDNNSMLSSTRGMYCEDKTSVLKEIGAKLDGYNFSQYTFDIRTGKQEPAYEIVDQVMFKHSEMFSETADSVWRYQYYQGGNWNNMQWNGAGYWSYAGTDAIIAGTWMHPHIQGQTVLTFVAPETGRIRISMEEVISLAAASADGTYITVLDDNLNTIAEPIWVTVANNNQTFAPVYVNVQKDEKIYFCMSKCENPNADATNIKPAVEYVYNDINMDESKSLDVKDIVRMKKMISQSSTDDVADYNGNGQVDKEDLSVLYRYLLKWWATF